MKKLINVELRQDIWDNRWIITVLFWKWEVAKFKVNERDYMTTGGIKTEPVIERMK